MNEVKLNLARKWRSKNFNEIVGQDLPVRMLKNGLYREQFFPVYLFSGQRGCGKTTTARVFAMALNCALLKNFQQDPQSIILPCLHCESCSVALTGKHPDFIEIDAASHTGVDNVRQIVEAASYLPVLGSKKIYLIDEAHMLSKAAFNALLKILEEPPRSTLFILATTDPHKIIDTVQSRCFQLFFSPIAHSALSDHLQNVCRTEQISFENDALDLIVQESEGSARDALNLLEQVRFSTALITKKAVLHVLGHLDDEQVLQLCEAIIAKGPADVLHAIKNIDLVTHDSEFVWQRLFDLLRALLWIKHGVVPTAFTEHYDLLNRIAAHCSFIQLNNMLETMYRNESAFQRVAGKHGFFEIMLLQMCKKNNSETDSNNGTPSMQSSVTPIKGDTLELETEEQDEEDLQDEDNSSVQHVPSLEVASVEKDTYNLAWNQFVKDLSGLNEPLIASVIMQGTYRGFNAASGKLTVEFSREAFFFKSLLDDTLKIWSPLLQAAFKQQVELQALFTGAPQKKTEQVLTSRATHHVSMPTSGGNASTIKTVAPTKMSVTKHVEKKPEKTFTPFNQKYAGTRPSMSSQNIIIDVSDASVWKTAHMLMRYFPGTVREIRE